MQSLGINSESIDYEVALENLGQRLQPFIMALQHEPPSPICKRI